MSLKCKNLFSFTQLNHWFIGRIIKGTGTVPSGQIGSAWEFKVLSRFMQKLTQPPACLDHGLHVLIPRSFLPNRASKMFFGVRLVSTEFHHPAIQTKIEQHFGWFFLPNKSAPASRKTGFHANRDPNKQEVGSIFAWSGLELWSLFKYLTVNLKNPKLVDVHFKAYPMVPLSCRSNLAGRYL